MSKIALEIKSNQMEAVLEAVMELAKKMKFEAKILSNGDEMGLCNDILAKLDKPKIRAVFKRLKDK
ncbi:hypothetical protein [Campylobacter mucosalis]|uniref:Uncharacterized protein n=1 Tax=Campylobacter mucosalis CCUG 21559 TaxID=1032067 RepID=A0A6G5QFZ5_9BACT|nr:hypothetical protein [Campylobacter mucosalis]QCD44633.1 hypothetical protein CMUC_0838 [Campylobacter mucosalis CCUG 21559]